MVAIHCNQNKQWDAWQHTTVISKYYEESIQTSLLTIYIDKYETIVILTSPLVGHNWIPHLKIKKQWYKNRKNEGAERKLLNDLPKGSDNK